jgi:hypothetical protein
MSTPLAELYQDPAIQYEAKCWKDVHFQSIDHLVEAVGPLGHISTQAALTEQLDGLEEKSEARKAAAMLLGSLPTEILLSTYGQEVTAWTLGNDDITKRTEDHTEELDVLGFNGSLLLQAVALSKQFSNTPKSSDVLAQQAVMETVLGNGLDKLDLSELLAQAALPGVTVSEKRVNDYGFVRLAAEFGVFRSGGKVYDWRSRSKIEVPGLFYDLWLDAPVGFALTYKGHPQAVVGVQAKGNDELFIRQLQGTRGIKYEEFEENGLIKRRVTGNKSARGLHPLDWQKLLVNTSAGLSSQLGFNSVGMASGAEVPNVYQCFMSHDEARRAYDAQADRLGFEQDEDDDWRRPLASFGIEQPAAAAA